MIPTLWLCNYSLTKRLTLMPKIINQARCDSIPLPFTNDVCLQIVADMGNSRSNTTTNMFSKTCFVNNKTCYLHFGFLSGKNIFAFSIRNKKVFHVCCLPVSTGGGRFIEQSEPHSSDPSRKICYVKNWSYFTLGESRRASFHQRFLRVILWKREKYKLT